MNSILLKKVTNLIVLKPGLTEQQIDKLATQLPSGQIPYDVKDLLSFASGFEFYGIEEVTFDDIENFGFENIFSHTVQLAGDGYGNFWILDVDSKGNWGSIFYVCHDSAVVVKHSVSLAEFIQHVHEFSKSGETSHLDIIHEKTVMEIWNAGNDIFIDRNVAKESADTTLAALPHCYRTILS